MIRHLLFLALAGIASAQSTGDFFHQFKTSGGRGESYFTPVASSLWGFDESGAFTLIPEGDYAPILHAHSFADLTSKPTTVAGYGITDAMSSTGTLALGGFGAITGILPPANLGTGSSIATKFLRGDGTWQTVSTTVDAADLTGNTLASGVTASSLTSLGTLGNIAVSMANNAAMNGFNLGTVSDTTSRPFNISQTWNNAGLAATLIKGDATASALASGSKLLDLSTGGTLQIGVVYNTTTGNDTSPWRLVFGSSASLGYSASWGAITVRNAANSADANLRASLLQASSGVQTTNYISNSNNDFELASNSYRPPAGLRIRSDGAIIFSSTTAATGTEACRLRAGSGTPEGAVTANVGSVWLRTDGGTGTTLYIKESGTGNTGWVAK
jgi:hypothetical protein